MLFSSCRALRLVWFLTEVKTLSSFLLCATTHFFRRVSCEQINQKSNQLPWNKFNNLMQIVHDTIIYHGWHKIRFDYPQIWFYDFAESAILPPDWPTNTMYWFMMCALPVALCELAPRPVVSPVAAAARWEHAGQTLRALAPMIPFYVLAPSGPQSYSSA